MPLISPARKGRNSRLLARIALTAAAAVVAIVGSAALQPAFASSQTALDPTRVPRVVTDSDTAPVELGLRFSSATDGTVDSIRFYKGEQNTGVHTGSLWTAAGELLARTTFERETASGWQTAQLPEPVTISAGETYVVSYHAPDGHYSADTEVFTAPRSRGDLRIPTGAGVYGYGESAFPSENWRNANYYVDLTFTPAVAPTPAPNEPGTPTGTVRPIDGGPGYFDRFTDSLPSDPAFFPIGVWFESIQDEGNIARDRAVGLNLYVELTVNSDTSLLGPDGPYAITSSVMPGISGQITTDEADMWGGPGNAAWTGNYPGQGPVCSPETMPCGYTIMETLRQEIPADTLAYSNYGKGVTFWESDAEASSFVNEYQDVVSADNYWFTDPNICGRGEGGVMAGGRALTEDECRLAANYGWTVDRIRSLVEPEGSKPVWVFVEVGHPSGEDSAPTIQAPEIRAAVWSGLIHGARGVVYFNHSFGGDCVSQHVLRDDCDPKVRPMVAAVNAQITRLAPVLNAPFRDGVTTTNDAVDHMTKVHDGRVYIFAASTQHPAQTATLSSACIGSGSLTVEGEDRTVTAVDGTFSDGFSGPNAVHIYSAPAAGACLG